MTYLRVHWDLDEDASGNVWHIAENGLTKEDVDEVLKNPEFSSVSNTSGRPLAFGRTQKGEYIAVVYEHIDGGFGLPHHRFLR